MKEDVSPKLEAAYYMADAKAEKKVSYESQESLYKKAVAKMKADEVIVQHQYRIDNALLAASMFESVGDYLDAPQLALECRERAKTDKEEEKAYQYEAAVRLEKEATMVGEWEKLARSYCSLGDYKDAPNRAALCTEKVRKWRKRSRIRKTVVLVLLVVLAVGTIAGSALGYTRYLLGYGYMRAGMYENASEVFAQMPGFLKADANKEWCDLRRILSGKPGSKVAFGSCSWIILAVDSGRYTMILADAPEEWTDAVAFDAASGSGEVEKNVCWETSSLRAWLNTEAIFELLGADEQERLTQQICIPSENAAYQTAWTEETYDRLTILSAEEAKRYAKSLKALTGSWWLRTPGHCAGAVAYMSADHIARMYGMDAADEEILVRPVICADFSDLKA